jgi:hypothetical protein
VLTKLSLQKRIMTKAVKQAAMMKVTLSRVKRILTAILIVKVETAKMTTRKAKPVTRLRFSALTVMNESPLRVGIAWIVSVSFYDLFAVVWLNTRVVAWEAFVCDACEKKTDNLPPWEFQARYREEVKVDEGHHVFHRLIRFREPDAEGFATSKSPGQSPKSPETVVMEEFIKQELEKMEERLWKKMEEFVGGRFGNVEGSMRSGMANIERMLATMSPPTSPNANGNGAVKMP